MNINTLSVVHKNAKIGNNVTIGPFCTVGENVEIGDGTTLISHVVVDGYTTIGQNCTIFPGAAIGLITQDLKFKGEKTFVKIGSGTTIRENVTVNSATGEGTETVVGDNCHIMAYAHIAHNCIVGNNVIIANVGTLAGCVTIEDQAIIGGLVAIHQFCRIGKLSIVGGCSKVVQDIPPYMMADGHPAVVRGINSVGMKRKGHTLETQRTLKNVCKVFFRSDLNTKQALEKLSDLPQLPEVKEFIQFVNKSERGICRP
ncbi:MAG: acyl-ACP--UDP-N-acetylglucosamine O-acyltransferase [Candidatus Ancaeobacter aquaticus]|nr:acyl-ACP--UDP-N-acetylglucosamine O-acyltransferase [Candidatus Ancaeobacter aquaticus]